MSIITWTSDGLSWPLSTYSCVGQYMEAIRLALVERANATSSTLASYVVSAGLSTPFFQSYKNYATFMYQSNGLLTSIINSGVWVNMNDHSGSWDSLASGTAIAPVWTRAALVSYIGTDFTWSLVNYTNRLSEWCYLMYQYLNQLKWRRIPFVSAENKYAFASSWATAVSNWVGGTWANGTMQQIPNPKPSFGVKQEYTTGPTSYNVSSGRALISASFPSTQNYDLYLYGDFSSPHYSGATYLDPIYSTASSGVWMIDTLSAQSGNVSTKIYDTGTTWPYSAPSVAGVQWATGYTCAGVAKFDVTSGFQFV